MGGWICGKDPFVEKTPGIVFRASRQKLFFFFLFFLGIFHGCRIIVSVVIAAANAFLYGSQKKSFDNAQIKETEDYQDFFCHRQCPGRGFPKGCCVRIDNARLCCSRFYTAPPDCTRLFPHKCRSGRKQGCSIFCVLFSQEKDRQLCPFDSLPENCQ